MGFLKTLLAKAQEYVKLAPWIQYVGLQVAVIPGLHDWTKFAATLVSAAAFFVKGRKDLGPNDPHRREILASAGYAVMVVGAALPHLPLVLFVGSALAMTEFVYELIYP